jgi:hypothetical protein
MGNLAGTYSDLGRHAEALAMLESVLELYRRVLPADHPDIGEGHVLTGAAYALLLILQGWPCIILLRRTLNSKNIRKRLR